MSSVRFFRVLRFLWKSVTTASTVTWLWASGGATVIGATTGWLARIFGASWPLAVPMGVGVALLALAALLTWRTDHAERPAISAPASDRQRWESRPDIGEGHIHILFSLRSRIGAQMVRGFACEVRSPLGGVPDRATSKRTGPSNGLSFTYPQDFGVAMSGLVPGTYEVVWYEADEDWKWIEIIRDKIDVPPVEARGGQRLSDAAIASARAGANRVLSDLKINRETIEHMLETRIWPVNPRTNQVFTDQHWAEVNRDLAAGGPQFDKAHGLAHDAFQALRRANIRSRGVSPSAQQGQAEVSDEDRRRLEVALEAIDAASAALIESRGVAAV